MNQKYIKIRKEETLKFIVYSLFVFVIRLQITRDYYLRRFKILFNYIKLDLDKTMEEKRRDYGSHT